MAERTLGVVTVIEHPPASDSFVLVEEIKEHKKGRLNLPGGGLNGKREKEESMLVGAVREAKEESGLEVELDGFLGLFDYREDGKLQIAFAAHAVGGKLQSSRKHPTVESYPFDIIQGKFVSEGRLRSERVVQTISQYREHQEHGGLMLPVEVAIHLEETDALPLRVIQPQESAAEPLVA